MVADILTHTKNIVNMYEQEKSEINILKSYLLSQIPTTPLPPNDILLAPNSVALKAAISGLDKELCRLEREERLVAKFTASANSDAKKNTNNTMGEDEAADMEYVKMSKEDACSSPGGATAETADDVNMDDGEWEEANPSPAKKHQKQDDASNDDTELVRCQSLASTTVTRISNANVKVHTPLGALALALHTALVELTYNEKADGDTIFRCTGVPDASVVSQFLGNDIVAKQTKGGGGGFALPVRELPRGELVPPKWEDNASSSNSEVIAFRYKCGKEVYTTDSGPTNDSTTMYLTVQLIEGNEVVVVFGTLPSPSSEKESTKLTFPLGQYANLAGFQAAKAKNGGGGVSPSLFYISLSELMFKFSSTFGLLSRVQKGESSSADASLKMSTKGDDIGNSVPSSAIAMNVPRPNIPPDGPAVDLPSHTDPLRVMDAQRKGKHKDFEGDLLPGGPQPGGLHEIPPRGMGSQVGPNHPMFDRTFGDSGGSGYDDEFGGGFGSGGPECFGVPGVGGMGMHPRYVKQFTFCLRLIAPVFHSCRMYTYPSLDCYF